MAKITHQIAYCRDCDWQNEDYHKSNCQKLAYAHAKKTGHIVEGETGTSWKYHFPKDKQSILKTKIQ